MRRRLAVATALGAAAALLATTASAASTSITPASTQQALNRALAAGLTIKALPSHLAPTLQQLSSDPYKQAGATADVNKTCDPYTYPSEARTPTPCWFGATGPKDPVIVIFGDSFVGNWMPALNVAARTLGYRVADFEFKGCFTALVPAKKANGFDQAEVNACDLWHQTLPPAVRRLHPAMILAANGTPSWMVPQSAWVHGMQLVFHDMNPSGSSIEALIGTGIHLNESAPSCLAASPGDVQSCTLRYTKSSATQLGFNRDAIVVAAVAHLHLIPTYQWVCRASSCPVVVNDLVVYADWDHLTIDYSLYLSHLFLAELRGLVRAPATHAAAARETTP